MKCIRAILLAGLLLIVVLGIGTEVLKIFEMISKNGFDDVWHLGIKVGYIVCAILGYFEIRKIVKDKLCSKEVEDRK